MPTPRTPHHLAGRGQAPRFSLASATAEDWPPGVLRFPSSTRCLIPPQSSPQPHTGGRQPRCAPLLSQRQQASTLESTSSSASLIPSSSSSASDRWCSGERLRGLPAWLNADDSPTRGGRVRGGRGGRLFFYLPAGLVASLVAAHGEGNWHGAAVNRGQLWEGVCAPVVQNAPWCILVSPCVSICIYIYIYTATLKCTWVHSVLLVHRPS
jgi:hypothetical protein